MNELDRALEWYHAAYPEKQRGKVTLTDLFFFLVHRIEELREQLKQPGRRKPKMSRKRSEENIKRSFAWAGMEGPKSPKPAEVQPEQQNEG
jgi:hypothetical protein